MVYVYNEQLELLIMDIKTSPKYKSLTIHDPADVGNLISGSSVLSKTSLNICKFTVYILLKPGLENFEHYFASM